MIHPMIATMTSGEEWMLGCTIVMALCTVGALIVALIALNKKLKIEQPLIMAMEKEFATKQEFERHVQKNDQEHKEMDSKIGGVQETAAAKLEDQIELMRAETKNDVTALHEKVNGAREQISEVRAQNTLQSQQLSRLDTKLDRIIENKLT